MKPDYQKQVMKKSKKTIQDLNNVQEDLNKGLGK
jgi:hypothetical protein